MNLIPLTGPIQTIRTKGKKHQVCRWLGSEATSGRKELAVTPGIKKKGVGENLKFTVPTLSQFKSVRYGNALL